MTGRFANVLCRSAKKRSDRCGCTYLVLAAVKQKGAIRMYMPRSFSHWSGESSYVTDPTRKRNETLANRTLAKRP